MKTKHETEYQYPCPEENQFILTKQIKNVPKELVDIVERIEVRIHQHKTRADCFFVTVAIPSKADFSGFVWEWDVMSFESEEDTLLDLANLETDNDDALENLETSYTPYTDGGGEVSSSAYDTIHYPFALNGLSYKDIMNNVIVEYVEEMHPDQFAKLHITINKTKYSGEAVITYDELYDFED